MRNPVAGAQRQMMEQMAGRFIETPAFDALLGAFVSMEMQLAESRANLLDALDADQEARLPDPEARKALLKELATKHLSGDLGEVWLNEVASDILDEGSLDKARAYLDLSDEEWSEQIGNWAANYRAGGVEGTDRDLAELHVERTFGVSLDEFEREIVGFSSGEAMRSLLAGTFDAACADIDAAAEQIRAANETAETTE